MPEVRTSISLAVEARGVANLASTTAESGAVVMSALYHEFSPSKLNALLNASTLPYPANSAAPSRRVGTWCRRGTRTRCSPGVGASVTAPGGGTRAPGSGSAVTGRVGIRPTPRPHPATPAATRRRPRPAPPVPAAAAPACVSVLVPDRGRVWFDGKEAATGNGRATFTSLPIPAGQTVTLSKGGVGREHARNDPSGVLPNDSASPCS